MPRLIMIDIDGVLADPSNRLHYLQEKDYDKFYGAEVMNDSVIHSGNALLGALHDYRDRDRLVYLTSRREQCRNLTIGWLAMHRFPIPGDTFTDVILSMRPDGDHRKSPNMKVKQIVDDKLMEKSDPNGDQIQWDEIFFIDDDPDNVDEVVRAFPFVTGLTFTAM